MPKVAFATYLTFSTKLSVFVTPRRLNHKLLPSATGALSRQLFTQNRLYSIPSTMTDSVVLDKESLKASVKTVGLRVHKTKTRTLMSTLRGDLLKVRGCRNVQTDTENADFRIVILSDKFKSIDDLPAEKKAIIEQHIEAENGVVEHMVDYGYEQMTMERVLHHLLRDKVGEEKEIQTSFEAMGHVAHMNLREPMLPYRNLIGRVLMDKNPTIKTVVNKTGNISTEFRTFPLEIIAGEDNLNVEMVEHGVRFRFNVSEVYWNSRLQEEHHRLVSSFKSGEVVADACCGIGPFAIPAALRHSCTVYANDLNPKSFQYLKENIKLNKVSQLVHPFNMDGRDFIREIMAGKKHNVKVDHFVLNLPAIALEFLDAFQGCCDSQEAKQLYESAALPMVHCYCFSNAPNPTEDVITRAETALGRPFSEKDRADDSFGVHQVRDVAPNKKMYRIDFRLPQPVAMSAETGEPDTKRTKTH